MKESFEVHFLIWIDWTEECRQPPECQLLIDEFHEALLVFTKMSSLSHGHKWLSWLEKDLKKCYIYIYIKTLGNVRR